jgi:hypothetical protein
MSYIVLDKMTYSTDPDLNDSIVIEQQLNYQGWTIF